VGSSRRRSKTEAIPKGNARNEKDKPEESEIQEGRGASVISPITLVTALEAGSKALKSRAIELARVKPQARRPNDKREKVRGNPERTRIEG
jgi:hypothetical protein